MDMCRKFLEMGFTRQEDMQIIEVVGSMIQRVMLATRKRCID